MHLTCMGKFLYMQACLAIPIIMCMHVLHVITLKHCHIVAMGITLVAQLSVINIADITFNKTLASESFHQKPSTECRSRKARQRQASMLVVYIS